MGDLSNGVRVSVYRSGGPFLHTSESGNEYLLQICNCSINLCGRELLIDVQFPRPYIIVMNIPSNLGQADIRVGHPVVTIVLETVESSPISRGRE